MADDTDKKGSIWDQIGNSKMNDVDRKERHKYQQIQELRRVEGAQRKRSEPSIWDRVGKPGMNDDSSD